MANYIVTTIIDEHDAGATVVPAARAEVPDAIRSGRCGTFEGLLAADIRKGRDPVHFTCSPFEFEGWQSIGSSWIRISQGESNFNAYAVDQESSFHEYSCMNR